MKFTGMALPRMLPWAGFGLDLGAFSFFVFCTGVFAVFDGCNSGNLFYKGTKKCSHSYAPPYISVYKHISHLIHLDQHFYFKHISWCIILFYLATECVKSVNKCFYLCTSIMYQNKTGKPIKGLSFSYAFLVHATFHFWLPMLWGFCQFMTSIQNSNPVHKTSLCKQIAVEYSWME